VKQLHPALKVILVILVFVLIVNIYVRMTPERFIHTRNPGTEVVFEANFDQGKLFIVTESQPKNIMLPRYTTYYVTQRFGLWRINISSSDFVFNDGTGRITASRLPNYPDQSKYVVWGGVLDGAVNAVHFQGNINEYPILVDPDTGLFVLLNVDATEFSGSEDSLLTRIDPIRS
jgi:hypothetical protein